MKKLALAIALTATAASVNAADSSGADLSFFVAEICKVEAANTTLNPYSTQAAEKTMKVKVQCNDVDGATVSFSSLNGGLKNNDNGNILGSYNATLELSDLGGTAADINLTLDTSNNQRVTNKSGSISTVLTEQEVDLVLDAAAYTAPAFSGTYSDVLTVGITAN